MVKNRLLLMIQWFTSICAFYSGLSSDKENIQKDRKSALASLLPFGTMI